MAVDYFVKSIHNHPRVSRFAVFDVSVTPQMYVLVPHCFILVLTNLQIFPLSLFRHCVSKFSKYIALRIKIEVFGLTVKI